MTGQYRILPLLILLGACLTAAPDTGASTRQALDPELRQVLQAAIEDSDSFEDRFEAEVWLTDMSSRMGGRVADPQERLDILKAIHQEARRARLTPELVLAVIQVESNFDRFAISVAGARGLMQVMPFWLDEIGHPDDDLFDIRTNLRMGCTILRYYLDKERGNHQLALARYNGSVGKRRYPDKVFRALNRRWYRR